MALSDSPAARASRKMRANWTPEHREYRQWCNNLRRYGLTPAEYEAKLAAQNGGCAICGGINAKSGQRLAVDHDHETGQVRGLLCNNCNSAIGKLRDSSATARLAVAYLEKWGN